jgi:subfamily B ATP-binding cassette protein MsbA
MRRPPGPPRKKPSSRELYLRLLRYVVPYRKQFGGGTLALVVLAATEPAIPALLKPLLDGTFVHRDPDYLFWIPMLFIALALVRGVMNFASTIAVAWVSGKVIEDLRKAMFAHLMSLPMAFYDSATSGMIITRLTNNVGQVANATTTAITTLVRDTLKIIGLLGYAFYLNWRLTLAALIVAPPIAVVVRVFAKRMRRHSRAVQDAMGHMTHIIKESIQGQKVVKVFEGQDYERRRFEHATDTVRHAQYKVRSAGAANVPIVELMATVVLAVMIYVGTAGLSDPSLTPGSFAAFFTAIALLISPIKSLAGVSQPIQRGLAAAENIFALLDEPREKDDGRREIAQADGNLAFENVAFRYPKGKRDAVTDISFEVPAGKTVALVGPSGSGKTTLAMLLPRFYNVGAGAIRLDGIDIRELSLRSLRANIALVSQDVVLFNDTVAGNIAYGLRPKPSREAIEAAARTANALEFIERMPDGFDTLIGENGVMLSGGQRQRIAIARALLKAAPLLILDEATSALDTEAERLVQEALQALQQGRTTLVIAHRLSTVEHADQVLVLDEGRVVEKGWHGELLALNGRYAELYKKQFRDDAEGLAGPSSGDAVP